MKIEFPQERIDVVIFTDEYDDRLKVKVPDRDNGDGRVYFIGVDDEGIENPHKFDYGFNLSDLPVIIDALKRLL